MKIKFLLLFLISFALGCKSFSVNKDRYDELQEKYATIINKIKKEKQCYVYAKEEANGYCYLKLESFDNQKKMVLEGICDTLGNTIIPMKYGYDCINYFPALDEGMSQGIVASKLIWHRKTESSFITVQKKKSGLNIYTFYRTDGSIILDNIEASRYSDFYAKGYVVFEKRIDSKTLRGICTTDGQIIVPIEYDDILFVKGKEVKLYKNLDYGFDEQLSGAAMLDNSLPILPCKFGSVNYDENKKCWTVFNKWLGGHVSCDEPIFASTSMAEDLYLGSITKNSFIAYCLKQFSDGIEEPNNLFYLADCLYEKASTEYNLAKYFIKLFQKGPISDMDRYVYYRQFDFDVVKDIYNIVYKMLHDYLQRIEKFQEITNIEAEQKIKYEYCIRMAKYKMDEIKSDINEMDSVKQEFKPIWEKFVTENVKLKRKMRKLKVGEFPSASQALFAAFITGVYKPTDSVDDLCNSINLLNN